MTTADLPPLPVPAIHERSPGGRNLFAYSEGQIYSYAKLAVREALERAAKLVRKPDKEGYFMDSARAAAAIRAMIEEYK